MSSVLDRAALYYPYITIPEDKINWFKATLLCFPQVRRIIPQGFDADDSPWLREFQMQTNAANEYLFESEYLDRYDLSAAYSLAQERLLRKLESHRTEILTRFLNSHGSTGNSYKIHRDKLHGDIWDFLIKNRLAVVKSRPSSHRPADGWLNVQADLGDAIMSTIAISIAKAEGLDIVTGDNEIISQSEEAIFDRLLNLRESSTTLSDAEKVDYLAQTVIQTRFDVTRLTAADIAELHKEGKSLMAFKRALLPIASEIPTIEDPEKRNKEFRKKADAVIAQWEKYKSRLPGFALAALVEAQDIKPPQYALSLIATGAAAWMPIVGVGIAIGVLYFKGYKIFQKFREGTANPFSYLTQIERQGAHVMALCSGTHAQ